EWRILVENLCRNSVVFEWQNEAKVVRPVKLEPFLKDVQLLWKRSRADFLQELCEPGWLTGFGLTTPKSSSRRELSSTVVLCVLWAGVTIPRESVLEFQATGAHSPTLFFGVVWRRAISVAVLGHPGQSVL